MHFDRKKAENCFSDAENYEYRLEVLGSVFAEHIQPLASELRVNDKLRRPTFIAQMTNGMQVKGLLDKTVIKVGYVPEKAAEQQIEFEHWLSELVL
jgi:hypothetical protein